MKKDLLSLLTGEVLEQDVILTLAELCQASQLPAERIFEFVDEGIVEPLQPVTSLKLSATSMRFHGVSLHRVHCALRLERDLGINLAGVALALDLLEELNIMRDKLRRVDY